MNDDVFTPTWDRCAYCGATPDQAEMTSDFQVGLLCTDEPRLQRAHSRRGSSPGGPHADQARTYGRCLMTIRELALRRVQGCGMSLREAELMLEEFARTQQGSIIGWDDIAPGLSRLQMDIIDRAGLGYRTRRNLNPDLSKPKPEMRDGKMLATGEGV